MQRQRELDRYTMEAEGARELERLRHIKPETENHRTKNQRDRELES